jgi:hypothetical protein
MVGLLADGVEYPDGGPGVVGRCNGLWGMLKGCIPRSRGRPSHEGEVACPIGTGNPAVEACKCSEKFQDLDERPAGNGGVNQRLPQSPECYQSLGGVHSNSQ